MKYLLFAFLALLMPVMAFAQPGGLFQGGEPITPDDPTGDLLQLFAIDPVTFSWMSVMVLFLTALIKRKLPDSWLGGWKTDVIAVVIALGLSIKIYAPEWVTVIVNTLACWLAPAGAYAAFKQFFVDGGLTDKKVEEPIK